MTKSIKNRKEWAKEQVCMCKISDIVLCTEVTKRRPFTCESRLDLILEEAMIPGISHSTASLSFS